MADLNIGNSSASVVVNAKHNGSVTPQINNTYDLGTSTLRWKNIYGSLKGNADSATKLAAERTISLTGSVTGSGTFDGSGNLSIATTTNHTHNYAGSASAGGPATTSLTVGQGNSPDIAFDANDIIVARSKKTFYTTNTDKMSNRPSGTRWGYLDIGSYDNNGTYMTQAFTDGDNGNTYIRIKYNNNWRSWKQLAFIDTKVNAAITADALATSAGSATQPVYFSGGKPVTCTYTLGKSVPSNAVFTDTTYSAGAGLTLSGTQFKHSNSVTAATAAGDASKTLTFGGTFTIPTVTYDAQGHITGKGTTTMTMPANPNTDTKVTQTAINASDYTNWRPLIWGSSNSATEGFTPSTVTDGVYTVQTLSCQPSSGTIRATTFKGNLSGNAATATKATQDSDGNAINTTYLKKRSMLETSVGSVTSGTSAGTQSVLKIYGPTYGNEASYLKTSGKFSYGDPGPQIQFSASAFGGQQAALIYTDHDTIGDGISLSLVTDQNDAWFIAPHIKALTGFVGNLSGNATTMSYPLGFSIRELNNWTNGDFTYDGFTTFVTDWAEPSGGSIYWASNSKGQLAAGIDGYFYQGRDSRDKKLHRCLDTYDLSNSKWGNSDKVDGYHASQLWRSDGAVWNPNANIALNASGNGQEWSFDIHRNGYTGCYWHVWDESRGTMLMVTPDSGKVSAPYGFVGTVEGPAWYLSNTSHNISISKSDWGASNPWGCTNRTLVWGQRGYNGSYSPDSADIVLYYGNTGASGGAGWFLHIDGGIYSMGGVYGAVWNDYAEFRESTDEQPGRVVMEDSKGICQRTEKRLQPFAGIISDTFGFSEGKTDKATTPLAVAGRVLAYPYQNRNNYKPGDCVCAAPNGTVDIMTREEVREWPDRIVGTVSEIPSYETWGTGNVKVDGRIWIKVK